MQSLSQGNAFSLDVLRAAISGNHGLAERVAHAFLKIKPELQSRLADALRTSDLQTAARAAHELHGMASIMGATQLAVAAAAMEASVNSVAADGLAQLQANLLAEWDAVVTALGSFSFVASG